MTEFLPAREKTPKNLFFGVGASVRSVDLAYRVFLAMRLSECPFSILKILGMRKGFHPAFELFSVHFECLVCEYLHLVWKYEMTARFSNSTVFLHEDHGRHQLPDQ